MSTATTDVAVHRPSPEELEHMVFTPIATGGGVWTIDHSSNRRDNATFYVDAAGYYHRDDGPSYLVDDMGACAWYQHGVLHLS